MRFSLATKLTLFIGGAMALVVMAIVLTVTFYVQQSLQKEYHLRCLSSAGYLARHIRAPLITNNLYSLHQYFQDTVQQDLFHSAMLLDSGGTVLMHNNLREIGRVYTDEQSRQALQADEPVISKTFLTEDGLPQDELFLPIVVAGMRLGTLRLSHSHAEIEKTVGDSRKKIILVGVVAILGSLLLANFLAAVITRPIRHLTEATKRVARGDLNLSVDGNKGDELGVLAQSFNAMTRELQKTTVSHDYLNNIFNSSSDAIRTINLEFDIVMNNRSMTDFLNGKAENLQGCKCYQLITADICNSEECVLQRIAQGEKFVQLETLIEIYDARKKYVRLTATPLMENGRIVGVIESIQDITEQKLAEKESRNLQTQLVQAQKMESVGRLAGGVAHDFNNILSVIIGYSQLGQLSVPKEHPLSEKLQIIQDASQKAAALVRQLLAFSRKQVLEMTVLNLNDVVADMMKMLSRVIGEDIKLEMSLNSARKIFGDHSQLVQVLMNLAVNARDAMPNGGQLVIETSDVDLDEDYSRIYSYVHPGPHVMLSISDTGIGMSPEVMKNIFEPFFTTKGPESGTGLGLSTVYGTVKQHGGHIHVYSEPDVGTTFKIYLPATDKENEAIITTDTWQDRRGSETILIVEDERVIRQLLKDILRPQGYQILMAANGREALELYKTIEGKLDVLLTDVIMPEMDGRELARRIAEMSPETKIIFMSGYAQSIIMQHASVREHSFFIQKPVTPSVLSAKLRQALGEQAVIPPS